MMPGGLGHHACLYGVRQQEGDCVLDTGKVGHYVGNDVEPRQRHARLLGAASNGRTLRSGLVGKARHIVGRGGASTPEQLPGRVLVRSLHIPQQWRYGSRQAGRLRQPSQPQHDDQGTHLQSSSKGAPSSHR